MYSPVTASVSLRHACIGTTFDCDAGSRTAGRPFKVKEPLGGDARETLVINVRKQGPFEEARGEK